VLRNGGPERLPAAQRSHWGESVVILTLVTVVVLGFLGARLSPDWTPPRWIPDHIDPPLAAPSGPLLGPNGIKEEKVRIPVEGTTLTATIFAPKKPGRYPGMVFVSGAGTGEQAGFHSQARGLAADGIVSITYDKRQVNYGFLKRDFALLARDSLTMLETLRKRADVQPDKVGMWGVSEGGWIVPLAASMSDNLAFTVLVASPTTTPRQQAAWSVTEGLRRRATPPGARDLAAAAVGLARLNFLDFDPMPGLRALDQPVLAIFGTADVAVPPVESAARLKEILAEIGNRHLTVRFFPGANHGMRIDKEGTLPDGYVQTMAGWITALPGYAPSVGKPRPSSTEVTNPVPDIPVPDLIPVSVQLPYPWVFTGGHALVMALGLVLAGYLAGPLATVGSRIRTRSRRPAEDEACWKALRRRLRQLLWWGVGTIVGTLIVSAALVALGFARQGEYTQVGSWIVTGSMWWGIRIVGIVTVATWVITFATLRRFRREGWRPSRTQWWHIGGVLLASGLIILVVAYWGLFALSW
jgi:uncharacterized protein